MYTFPAQHGTPHASNPDCVLRAEAVLRTNLVDETTPESPTVYNGHLGVLRQGRPTLERQRRYDFWFKRA